MAYLQKKLHPSTTVAMAQQEGKDVVVNLEVYFIVNFLNFGIRRFPTDRGGYSYDI